MVIAVLLGGGFVFLKDKKYQSELSYTIDNLPPYYSKNKVLSDFKNIFYSKIVFEDWKKNNTKSSLVFEDISLNQIVDGISLAKSKDSMLAVLDYNFNNHFLFNTNKLPVIDDLFKYVNYINQKLSSEYVLRVKNDFQAIDIKYKHLTNTQTNINTIKIILSFERFINVLQNGGKILSIERPKMPKKISPKSSLIFALSFLFGGVIGVLFIFIRNAIKNKKRLAKD